MYSIEHVGEWAGVVLPSWIRFFDCRCEDKDAGTKTPWGGYLWGSERAAVDLGLRGKGYWEDTTPLSCSTYIDARKAGDKEVARQLTQAIQDAQKFLKEWEEATHTEGQGGSCLYCPVGITISNYGWSIISDRRTIKVRAFR